MTPFCDQNVLWTSGTAGYDTYRIPALITTTSGALLAFCEGRRNSRSDTGDIDMLIKRSDDGGTTWSEQETIWADAENTCGNPCPVVDRDTGAIHLLMTHNLGTDREPEIIDRTSSGTRTVWVTSSSDDGHSWSTPQEITSTTKQPDWTWYATGPGNGIQLENGRLLIPCDHIEAGTKRYFSHVIYSDDHGASWLLGGSTSDDLVNECCIVELGDGTVMLNMRNYDREKRTRQIARSADGGLTWSAQTHDEILIEPICQAALIRYPGQEDRLIFSNPASRESRTDMTVRYSPDGGRSWPHTRLLHAGPTAYSSLTVLHDLNIGCLYESGDETSYDRITLARFNLDWLIQNGQPG